MMDVSLRQLRDKEIRYKVLHNMYTVTKYVGGTYQIVQNICVWYYNLHAMGEIMNKIEKSFEAKDKQTQKRKHLK